MRHEGHQEDTHDDRTVYRELSCQIAGCAIAVHKALGPGFPEAVYERALEAEFPRKESRANGRRPTARRMSENQWGFPR
jgi:GxxExxY protein